MDTIKQNAGSTHRRNMLVMKASAGSGKTYNLAKQYIRHLLFTTDEDGALRPRRHRGDDRIVNAHRQLLAITFTNKATDEMKDRIVNELYNLAQPNVESDYLEEFVRDSRLDEGQVRDLARHALNELLFDYSNFNVSTIDSFFQTILRNFARELDRDFNYEIQLEEKYAVRVAVHNFLLSLGQHDSLTQVDKWVKEYQHHLLRGDAKTKEWKFFNDGGDLNNFAQQINTEVFRSKMDDIRSYLGHVDEQGNFVSDFGRIRDFKQAMHEMVKRSRDTVEQTLDELLHTLQTLATGLKGNSALNNVLKNGGFKTASLKGADEAKVASQFLKGAVPDGETVSRITAMIARYFSLQSVVDFYTYIDDNLGLLGLLAMIDLFLDDYRHETNSILIGDTNDLIGTVLDSGSEFVYERVGTVISHFMIDEFQDTSTKQYENFRGLLKESLANGNFNMLIGDAKQSIYRFRNADPTVFREKVEADFADDIDNGLPASQDEHAPTSTNYRSSRNIIGFNNSLFRFVQDRYSGNPVVTATYRDVKQGMPANIDRKPPGYVRLLTGNYNLLLEDEFIKGAMDHVPEGDVDVLAVLPAYLLKLHQRYEWGKIGILVNKNDEGNSIVERILEYNQHTTGETISIVSGESLLLNNSSIIRRIIAMLRFIDISQFGREEDDPDAAPDENLARRMDRIQRQRESDQRLYSAMSRFIKALSTRPDGSPLDNGKLLVESLAQGGEDDNGNGENVQSIDSLLARLLPSAGELSTLVSIVETIIGYFKRDASLAGGDVDRETAFLMAFQDTVMQYCSQRNGGSVREFLKYWDDNKDRLAVNSADNGNAVNIMTIHKAKGLEFGCVIIPFAEWRLEDVSSATQTYWLPGDVFVDAMGSIPVDCSDCPRDTVPPLVNVKKSHLWSLGENGMLVGKARDYLDKQQTDVLIDNLNKTYVALTRPRIEMHIFTSGVKDGTVSELLATFAMGDNDHPGQMTPISQASGESTGWFETGQLSTREQIALSLGTFEEEADPQHRIDTYQVNPIPLTINVRVEHAASSHIKAGIRLHSLLSGIHDRNDVDRAISRGLKHGSITSDADDPCGIDMVDKHVRQVIMDPDSRVAAWFDPANKVYSERTITSASDNLWDEDGIENLRPDRIVRRPDGTVLVIDYKSGERNDKKYCRQVQRYIDRLRLVFPGADIRGRIWYVTRDVILDHTGKVL